MRKRSRGNGPRARMVSLRRLPFGVAPVAGVADAVDVPGFCTAELAGDGVVPGVAEPRVSSVDARWGRLFVRFVAGQLGGLRGHGSVRAVECSDARPAHGRQRGQGAFEFPELPFEVLVVGHAAAGTGGRGGRACSAGGRWALTRSRAGTTGAWRPTSATAHGVPGRRCSRPAGPAGRPPRAPRPAGAGGGHGAGAGCTAHAAAPGRRRWRWG
jgi:hypothetical protein